MIDFVGFCCLRMSKTVRRLHGGGALEPTHLLMKKEEINHKLFLLTHN